MNCLSVSQDLFRKFKQDTAFLPTGTGLQTHLTWILQSIIDACCSIAFDQLQRIMRDFRGQLPPPKEHSSRKGNTDQFRCLQTGLWLFHPFFLEGIWFLFRMAKWLDRSDFWPSEKTLVLDSFLTIVQCESGKLHVFFTIFLIPCTDFEPSYKIYFSCLPELILSQIKVPYKCQFLRKSQ